MTLLLLLFLLPSQLAYHFWPSWSLVNGIRVDYLAPTLYLTDILIFILFCQSKFKIFNLKFEIIVFVTLNIFFSLSPFVTIYKWIRVYEYYWFFKYFLLKIENWKLKIATPLGIAIVWTTLLSWLQFINQRSMGGVWYWLGERTFNLTTPGIAKIDLWGRLFLRPYATFPHPNALAGFLLLAFFLLKNKFTQLLALLTIPITFSRTIIFFIFPLILFFNFGNPNSFSERWTLIKQSIEIIKTHSLFGTGLGTFPIISTINHQPVHNILLLLVSELGAPFVVLIIWLIVNYLKIENWKLKIPVIIILITGLVDHYWLTSQQNILLLVIILATTINDHK